MIPRALERIRDEIVALAPPNASTAEVSLALARQITRDAEAIAAAKNDPDFDFVTHVTRLLLCTQTIGKLYAPLSPIMMLGLQAIDGAEDERKAVRS